MEYEKNIEMSLCQLQELAGQRDAIEHQMGKLHMAVRALCNLVDDKADREAYKAILDRYPVRTGLTDLVSYCLNTLEKPLTATEIRNFVKNYGSEASTSQNLLQSVHTILKRLEESGKAKAVTNDDGERAYRPVTMGERLMRGGLDQSTATVTEKRFSSLYELMRPTTIAPIARPSDADKSTKRKIIMGRFKEDQPRKGGGN
jgi:hypothetical protein